MQNRYNSRSPAVCQASQEGGWIVGIKNDADYMDMRETVNARRRQKSAEYSFVTGFHAPIT